MAKKKIGEIELLPHRYRISLKKYENKFKKDLLKLYEFTGKQTVSISAHVDGESIVLYAITTKKNGKIRISDFVGLK